MASLSCLVLLLAVKSVLSARVVGISAFSSGSHYIVVRDTLQELASRGHEVGTLAACIQYVRRLHLHILINNLNDFIS